MRYRFLTVIITQMKPAGSRAVLPSSINGSVLFGHDYRIENWRQLLGIETKERKVMFPLLYASLFMSFELSWGFYTQGNIVRYAIAVLKNVDQMHS